MNRDDSSRRTSFAGTAYEAHGRYLRRYLMRRLSNAQDVRELAQETWTRLLRVTDPGRVHEPLAYVRRTAANVLSEFRMRREREPVTYDSQVTDYAADNPAQLPPDELLDRLNTQRQVQRVLASLPPMYRQILLLRLCDGMEYGHIGQQMGLTASTTERYFFRAMNAVRAARWD